MIKNFIDKDTERLYRTGRSKKFPPDIWKRAVRKLDMLRRAKTLEDLKVPPSDRLEALKGDLEGGFTMNIKEFKEALKYKQQIKAVPIAELKREPTHPGEILEEEFMKPLGLSQSKLARELGVSVRAVNEIVNKKRRITPEMAIRLAERFGTSAEFWLGLQMDYDLWKAYNKPSRKFKKKKAVIT